MKPRITLPPDEFPRKFQLAIKRLKKPRKGRRRYSEKAIGNTVHAFGQYLFVMQREGMPLEISRHGLGAFIDDLDARALRNRTRLSYLTCVQAVAKETEYPASDRRLILEDCEIYREATRAEVPIKVRNLAANPITLADVAKAAVKWRKEAKKANNPNTRLALFNRAGVLALLSLIPIRIKDVHELIVGQHIFRCKEGWSLKIMSSKTGFRHNGPLHHSLTPFLDDLLLYGEGGSAVGRALQRSGTPLFSNEGCEKLSSGTLRYHFKKATGHTPHIVRTLVHDAMAQHGNYGAELARILCGQTSPQIAKHYEVHAEKFRAQKAQEILAHIQAKTLSRDAPQDRRP